MKGESRRSRKTRGVAFELYQHQPGERPGTGVGTIRALQIESLKEERGDRNTVGVHTS